MRSAVAPLSLSACGVRRGLRFAASNPHRKIARVLTASRVSVLSVAGFVLGAFVVFARLGELPLLDPDEGRNAAIAKEMATNESLIVPTYNQLPYLDKPALYFQWVRLSIDALGPSELAARLPSAMFGFATLVMVYGFCRHAYSNAVAAMSVVVLATMPLFQAFSRIVIFDIALTFFVCGAVFAGFMAENRAGGTSKWLHRGGAACAGVATLVKGPVGFILPSLVLVGWALIERRPDAVRRWFSLANVVLFIAVVLPWFIAVSLERPDFPRYGLVHESLNRFTRDTFERGGPFYYYLPVLVAVCSGWSCLFLEGAWLAWRRRSASTPADRLLLCWVVVVPAFFSLSQSKLPGYVLSAVVALAILTARLVIDAARDPNGSSIRAMRRGLWVLVASGGLGLVWLTVEIARPGTLSSMVGIRSAEYDVMSAQFSHFVPSLALTVTAAVVALVSRKLVAAVVSFGLLPVSLIVLSFDGWRAYAEAHSSRELASSIRALAPAESTIVCLECFPPGLAFYSSLPLRLVTEDGTEMTSNYIPVFLSQPDPWPREVIHMSRFTALLSGTRGAVILLAKRDRWAALDRVARARNKRVHELSEKFRAVVLPPRHAES